MKLHIQHVVKRDFWTYTNDGGAATSKQLLWMTDANYTAFHVLYPMSIVKLLIPRVEGGGLWPSLVHINGSGFVDGGATGL